MAAAFLTWINVGGFFSAERSGIRGIDVHELTGFGDGYLLAALASIAIVFVFVGADPTRWKVASMGVIAAGILAVALTGYEATRSWERITFTFPAASDMQGSVHGSVAAPLYAALILSTMLAIIGAVWMMLEMRQTSD